MKLETHLLHHGQNEWLRVVVTICADTQVNLLARVVSTIGSHQPEEGILWCERHGGGIEQRGRGHGGGLGGGVVRDL
jgi:hypothetical protein